MAAGTSDPKHQPAGGQSVWLSQTELTFLQRQAAKVLVSGRVPKHVAFIMDGNRRWARMNGFDSVLVGHVNGFEQLSKTLKYCSDLGITTVTVYAFSLENFKRSKAEVDGLMQLATEKFAELLKEESLRTHTRRTALRRHGVRVRVLGDLSHNLPADLRRSVAAAQLATEHNQRCTLNVCLAYTGRDEIVRAVRRALEAVHDGDLEQPLLKTVETGRHQIGEEEMLGANFVANRLALLNLGDITESTLSHCMDLCPEEVPDLLIRTSGEKRLSDFLLWHLVGPETVLHFTDVLWPDFGFWQLAKAILHYQWVCGRLETLQQVNAAPPIDCVERIDESEFCRKLRQKARDDLVKLASS